MKELQTAGYFFDLAIENFKSGDFQLAIDAFNQSLLRKEDWKAYQGLGSALCSVEQYQPAIAAFNQSLVLKEHWQSYKGLGWALYFTQQYQKAIEVFQKSLALKEHWQSYQGLGWALHFTQQYQKAIEVFQKSLVLKEHWQSYQGLGWALLNVKQYQQAIDAFNKSLLRKEDWKTYQGLGSALNNAKQYPNAIHALVRAWKMNKDKELLKQILDLIGKTYPSDYSFLLELLRFPKTKPDLRQERRFYLDKIKEVLETGYINPLIIWSYAANKKMNISEINASYNDQISKVVSRANNTNLIGDELLKSTKSKHIVSFGDSHGMIFSNHKFIKHFPLKAPTMYKINNTNSSSGSHDKIIEILANYKPQDTSIILTLGEIDLRNHVHKQSRIQNRLPELIVNDIADNYIEFLDKLRLHGYNLLVNNPHCGGGDGKASVPLEERNDMCLYMNSVLLEKCRDRNITCTSLYDIVVDPITRKNRECFYFDEHHLHLPINKIGKSLQSILISRFLNQYDLVNEFKIHNDRINAICNILISDIPGWLSIDFFLTDSFVREAKLIEDNNRYFQLIELPFPLLIKEISLHFESKEIKAYPSSSCYGIYESCDPILPPEKNIFQGISKVNIDENYQNIKIEHDFSGYHFNNMHARYIFISISNTEGTRLTKIGVSRLRYSVSN